MMGPDNENSGCYGHFRFCEPAESRAALLAQELSSESPDLIHVLDSLALESLRNLTSPWTPSNG